MIKLSTYIKNYTTSSSKIHKPRNKLFKQKCCHVGLKITPVIIDQFQTSIPCKLMESIMKDDIVSAPVQTD